MEKTITVKADNVEEATGLADFAGIRVKVNDVVLSNMKNPNVKESLADELIMTYSRIIVMKRGDSFTNV